MHRRRISEIELELRKTKIFDHFLDRTNALVSLFFTLQLEKWPEKMKNSVCFVAALSSVTKRFHSKTVSESISKADKRSALPPLDSQLKDTALKRTMRADLAGITTVSLFIFLLYFDA